MCTLCFWRGCCLRDPLVLMRLICLLFQRARDPKIRCPVNIEILVTREGAADQEFVSHQLEIITMQMSNGHNLESDKNAFNLETCVRPNILSLKPYRCARE